jgi:hypothetical protein
MVVEPREVAPKVIKHVPPLRLGRGIPQNADSKEFPDVAFPVYCRRKNVPSALVQPVPVKNRLASAA